MDDFDTAQPAGFWREQLTFVGLTVTNLRCRRWDLRKRAAGMRGVAEQMEKRRTSQGTILRVQHRRFGTICMSRRPCSLHAVAELWQRLAYVEPKPDARALQATHVQGFDESKQCQCRTAWLETLSNPLSYLCSADDELEPANGQQHL
jgi:hypothetical protein